ncbi:MAG: hypothetical protein WHT45_04510 [Ignavibacterium sp.]
MRLYSITNYELVSKLSKVLDLEVTYPPILLVLNFLLFQSAEGNLPIVSFFIIGAAKFFIPFISYVLIVEKRYGWLISLVVFIVIPSIIIYFIVKDLFLGKYFLLLPFVAFYFYCLLLKFSVKEWLNDYDAKMERDSTTT